MFHFRSVTFLLLLLRPLDPCKSAIADGLDRIDRVGKYCKHTLYFCTDHLFFSVDSTELFLPGWKAEFPKACISFTRWVSWHVWMFMQINSYRQLGQECFLMTDRSFLDFLHDAFPIISPPCILLDSLLGVFLVQWSFMCYFSLGLERMISWVAFSVQLKQWPESDEDQAKSVLDIFFWYSNVKLGSMAFKDIFILVKANLIGIKVYLLVQLIAIHQVGFTRSYSASQFLFQIMKTSSTAVVPFIIIL